MNRIVESMLKYQHVNFDERPLLDRDNPDKMVLGYVNAALEDWPFKSIHDLEEATYTQMVRDCAYFWWRFRDPIGELTWFHDQGLEDIGARFWRSRQDVFGGFFADEDLGDLHTCANVSMGPVLLQETFIGTLEMYWED